MTCNTPVEISDTLVHTGHIKRICELRIGIRLRWSSHAEWHLWHINLRFKPRRRRGGVARFDRGDRAPLHRGRRGGRIHRVRGAMKHVGVRPCRRVHDLLSVDLHPDQTFC